MQPIICQEQKNSYYRISISSQSFATSMLRSHTHKEYELFYLDKGKCYYFIDHAVHFITAGTFVLIKPGIPHRTTYVRTDDGNKRILLLLNDDHFHALLKQIGLPSLSILSARPVVHLTPDDAQQAKKICYDIVAQQSSDEKFRDASANLLILELLLLLFRCVQTAPAIGESSDTPPNSAKVSKVNEAMHYIMENFARPISLKDIADSIYVSRGYISRAFNEVTGFKITDYINLQRINLAYTFLQTTDLSITEIAGNCGFESISYFDTLFRQYTGTSPQKYRRETGKQQDRNS